MHKFAARFSLLAATAIVSGGVMLYQPVQAHPGGLNAEGCHGGSQPYHCHKKKAKLKERTQNKVEKNKDRIDSLKEKRQEAVETGDKKAVKRTTERIQNNRERIKNTREAAKEKRKKLILKNKEKNSSN